MILVLNLNIRERQELMMALSDHRRSLIEHGVEGRAKLTNGIYMKVQAARAEAQRRP